MARSEDLKTPEARWAFVNGLFELQTTQSGKKQWNVTGLWPKAVSLKALEDAAVEAAVAEWGDKAKQMIKDGLIHSPFLDGDGPQGKSKKTGEPHAGFPGHKFVRFISGEDYRPKIFDQRIMLITSKEAFKSGDFGFGRVNAFTWENKEKGKGISFGISMIQKSRDGDPLGGSGGGNPEDFFEKIADEGDAPDSVKSGEGAGGLFG